ncbi:MAG: DUF362 domain-containing protein, partial [Clostridia bacterium]|nr:DUF362 domain-containing protein [Clostridia bacterium]
ATIVESPGGPYNASLLKRVYLATGMDTVATDTGAILNFDLRVEKIENPDAKIVKSLKVLKPLLEADLIINLAKLKTHGFMVYTGCVKNMFGSIAGMEKADYHLRLNEYDQFADSLIDIYLATKPKINILDGIIAMEGDGPSSGVPKYLGVVMASEDAFAVDYAALNLIDVNYKDVPVFKMAEARGLLKPEDVELFGVNLDSVKPDSFEVPAVERMKTTKRLSILGFLGKKLKPQPEIMHEKCLSCGKCIEVCPPQVISKKDDKKVCIDYTKCISCFCCHEFCPEKAIRIKKNVIRRLFEYKRL